MLTYMLTKEQLFKFIKGLPKIISIKRTNPDLNKFVFSVVLADGTKNRIIKALVDQEELIQLPKRKVRRCKWANSRCIGRMIERLIYSMEGEVLDKLTEEENLY